MLFESSSKSSARAVGAVGEIDLVGRERGELWEKCPQNVDDWARACPPLLVAQGRRKLVLLSTTQSHTLNRLKRPILASKAAALRRGATGRAWDALSCALEKAC